MLYPGFIERKELNEIQANLKRLKEEKRLIDKKIKEETKNKERAEHQLDLIVNPIKHLKRDRIDEDYAVLYRNEYKNKGDLL